MFDAIGVSEHTRRPWTVTVSFMGQLAMVGLGILVPLVGTDKLPHPLAWVALPEPPRGVQHRPTQATPKKAAAVPFQMERRGLVLPAAIPDKVVTIVDTDSVPDAGSGVGVPGGIGEPGGSGASVIDSILSAHSQTPPPPMPVVQPAARPAPIPRIRLGGLVEHGKLISGPTPVYPPLARTARIEGTVRLEAVISRDGAILDLKAVSGHPMLVPAALAAVRQWVFRPTYLNGEPVEVATEIDVNFVLQK